MCLIPIERTFIYTVPRVDTVSAIQTWTIHNGGKCIYKFSFRGPLYPNG